MRNGRSFDAVFQSPVADGQLDRVLGEAHAVSERRLLRVVRDERVEVARHDVGEARAVARAALSAEGGGDPEGGEGQDGPEGANGAHDVTPRVEVVAKWNLNSARAAGRARGWPTCGAASTAPIGHRLERRRRRAGRRPHQVLGVAVRTVSPEPS